ncbi:Fe-S cluster assembly sulfur transfer protein SufU [Brachybacterium sp. AOP25-B2-12]|uniref:Fe-S cluster assembly sulfur transfer protein SufU n=1 Tax=Brachybacterium sp. AOP25-B2-12 TaxID=3457710 RepID=UPI004033F1A0
MSIANLDSLYTEIIFEHDKRPQRYGLREPFEAEVHHVNPTCGDEITLRVHVTGEGEDAILEDLSYESQGCAMSRASASIMADLLHGRTLAEAAAIVDSFELSMASRGKDPGDEDLIGDGVALLGASKFPGRVKCVVMAWKAYRAALVESGNGRV